MVSYKTAQQVGEATVADARKATGTEDISGCCKGGDGRRRSGVRGCPRVVAFKCEGTGLASNIEEPRVKVARVEKWF